MNQEHLRRSSLPVFSEFSGGFSLGGFPIQPPWVGGCGPAVAPVLPELVTGFVGGIRLSADTHSLTQIGSLLHHLLPVEFLITDRLASQTVGLLYIIKKALRGNKAMVLLGIF